RLPAQGGFDAVADYAVPLALAALHRVVGIPAELLDQAADWAETLLDFIMTDPDPELTRRTARALEHLRRLVVEPSRPADPAALLSSVREAMAAGVLDE